MTTPASTTRTFKVLASKRAAFEQQMARLAKKAAKLGVAAPAYVMGDAVFEERTGTDEDTGLSYKYLVEIYPTTVTAIVVQLPGWTFLATLEHLEGGETLVRSMVDEALPVEFRTATAKCDHCKLARKRNDTYVVRSDAGQVVQIGKSCIADFLGHKNPEQLAALAEYVSSVVGDDGESWGNGAAEQIADIVTFQTIVQTIVRTTGFVGKKLAEESGKSTTSSTALRVLFPHGREERKESEEVKALTTDADREKAQASIDWILNLDGEVNDFIHNVRAVVRTGAVKPRMAGYAAALSVAYARAMDDLREKVARPESKHVGVVGERAVYTVTIRKIIAMESQFGVTQLHIMTDADGNDLKWFGSGLLWLDMGLGVPGRDATEGDTVTVKATVKAHTEYKGRAQTMLSRCAVYVAPEPKVKKPRAKKAAPETLGFTAK